jgi:hypothetical protein
MPRHIDRAQFRELRTGKYAAFVGEFCGHEEQRICFPQLHYANEPIENTEAQPRTFLATGNVFFRVPLPDKLAPFLGNYPALGGGILVVDSYQGVRVGLTAANYLRVSRQSWKCKNGHLCGLPPNRVSDHVGL